MDTELIIRPARPDDRPAMERICAHTWEWGDYIPEVWDEWLADRQGQVIVGELAGHVVALSKITFTAPDEVWLEGMRVHPEYRGRRIASDFLDYSLSHARDHGARVVRLGTGDHNMAAHAILARAGMERIGSYVLWSTEPSLHGPEPTFLAREHAVQVQAFLRNSPVLAHTHGLYSVDWAWQELSDERMAQFLEEGRVAAVCTRDGQLVALATVHFDPADQEAWVSFVDGQPEAVAELASAIRTHAARSGAEKVRVMLPDLIWLRDAFHAAGYGSGDWEGELWVFERWLLPKPPALGSGAITAGQGLASDLSDARGDSGGNGDR